MRHGNKYEKRFLECSKELAVAVGYAIIEIYESVDNIQYRI